MTSAQGARRGNLGILAGALFAVLWFGGSLAQGANSGSSPFPRPTDNMDVAQKFFQESGTGVELNGGLQILAAIALLAFAGVMTGFLRRVGRDGSATNLVLAGGALSAGMLMIGGGVLATLGNADVSGDAPLTQALNQISFWLGGPLHVATLGVMITAAATALSGLAPKWVTVSGLVVGVLGLLAGLTGLVEVMAMFTLFGRFLGFVWLVVVGIALAAKKSPPVGAPASARSQG